MLFSYKFARRGVKKRRTGNLPTARKERGSNMAGIFTRPEIARIINDESIDADERINRIMSLRGQDLEASYVSKSAAKASQDEAIRQAKEAWEKDHKPPEINVKETEEYKALQADYDGYKTRQAARISDDYKEVKPKFFDMVYDRIDHADGAKPVTEQLADMRKDFEEYFIPAAPQNPAPKLPQFGAKPEGGMPKGEEGAVAAFTKAWGFNK